MDIISKKEEKNRIEDGINTLLSLNDEDFDEVIRRLSIDNNKAKLEDIYFFYLNDNCKRKEAPEQIGLEKIKDENGNIISRLYFRNNSIDLSDILKKLEEKKEKIDKNSIEYNRIERILNTRNLESFKKRVIGENEDDKELIDKIFEIVSNDELCEKFINYNENKDEFNIDGKEIEIEKYLFYLKKIFGVKNEGGELTKLNEISKDFYIKDLEKYKERYSKIYDNINFDKYLNPQYNFKNIDTINHKFKIIRKNEEPDFTINKDLKDYVYANMPKDLTIEEKAIYIYLKLCKTFSYNDGYFFRGYLGDKEFNDSFSKERLENINKDSKIICWDFARLYSKFINELGGNIEAVTIKIIEGDNLNHYFTGFYTDNVSTILEAINKRMNGVNDLMKAKNGIKLDGVEIISDKKGIINNAINKLYPLVFNSKEKNIEDYVKELRTLIDSNEKTNIIDENKEENNKTCENERNEDFEKMLSSFTEIMKKNNLHGNEAVQSFFTFNRYGFFDQKFHREYMGRKVLKNQKEDCIGMILIMLEDEKYKDAKDRKYYLLDSESLKFSKIKALDLCKKIKSGELMKIKDQIEIIKEL